MQQCVQLNRGKPFRGVIHIGAHLGEEALSYYQAGVKNVLWIEANKNLMAGLFDSTKKFNSVGLEQEYYNLCLSDVSDEIVSFNIANNGQSSSILEFGKHAELYPHIKYTNKIEMKTTRFDEFAKNKKIELALYDFVNLDIQGAELKALKGFGDIFSTHPHIRAIYTEINTDEIYKDCAKVENIDEYLQQFGFQRVATRMEPGAGWGDALYLR